MGPSALESMQVHSHRQQEALNHTGKHFQYSLPSLCIISFHLIRAAAVNFPVSDTSLEDKHRQLTGNSVWSL